MRLTKFLVPIASGLAASGLLLTGASVSAAVRPATKHPTPAKLDSVGLPRPELRSIEVGWNISATSHDVDIARYENLFQKYGVVVRILQFTSDTTEIDALISGQIKIALNTGTGAVLASQLTSTPLESVFVGQTNITDNLYSAKGITTAQQLIGHSIAVSSYASTTYGEALIALKQLHLTPKQVTITKIGGDSSRRAALLSGSVGASLNDRAEAPQLLSAGASILLNFTKIKNADLLTGDVTVTKSFAKQDPNTVLAVVAALTEGNHIFLKHPAIAIKAGVAIQGATVAGETQQVQYDLQGFRPDNGYMKLFDWQESRIIYSATDPQLVSVEPSKAYTDQFVNELWTSGFDKRMGIPKN
ncbi:MAG TPA: ABC transporter substrate-binding protein [Acidimicrobiales bacterium]|nr:ABC transporter substrate-binding protein [Acidimicrobiales bacterium]